MSDLQFMRLALWLARKGIGTTSPNPTVGAVLVKAGKIIGRGHTAPPGGPHAEISALRDAQKRGNNPKGATLYVTLEPCCTHGRTPPCTDAIIAAGIKKVVVGATDPNPKHVGKGFELLERAGITVVQSPAKIAAECARLNEGFNHWIVQHTPFVIVKAAMTLDGKIATASGESKWITGEKARDYGMKLRQGCDAILVGVNTVIADNPSLTVRVKREDGGWEIAKPIRRIILDPNARTPLTAQVVCDEQAALTTIVVSKSALKNRVIALSKKVNVLVAPVKENLSLVTRHSSLDLQWLLEKLGSENITSLLVEGGGETNAAFLLQRLTQRIAFFYAPKIIGGRNSRKGVAGDGLENLADKITLEEVEWLKLGDDLLLTARVS